MIKGPPSPVYISDRKNLVLNKNKTNFVYNSLDHDNMIHPMCDSTTFGQEPGLEDEPKIEEVLPVHEPKPDQTQDNSCYLLANKSDQESKQKQSQRSIVEEMTYWLILSANPVFPTIRPHTPSNYNVRVCSVRTKVFCKLAPEP